MWLTTGFSSKYDTKSKTGLLWGARYLDQGERENNCGFVSHRCGYENSLVVDQASKNHFNCKCNR